MSEQGPTVFNGRYELLRHIARGGMADVYLARDELLDREVALKVLFPEFANDPSFVERFRREAQAAANLNHPNIVGIYDWGQERGTYYIVMEHVSGRSMSDVLRSTGPLSPDRAAEIASDVAGALGVAHAAGLVHRDVKLGNILVSDGGDVKVADFGIATALHGGTDAGLTQHGSVMGTATYFSPEQAQGKAVDGRSDLYSLGVVLYEMLAGAPPFQAETPVAVAYKHVQEKPEGLRARGVNVAQSLEAITMKLLAKSPANRYPVAEDLRNDLRRYLAGAHKIPGKAGGAAAAGAAGGAAAAAAGASAASAAPVDATTAQPVTAAAQPAQPVQQPAAAQPAMQPGSAPAGVATDPNAAAMAAQYQGGYYYEEAPRGGGIWRTVGLLAALGVLVVILGLLFVQFLDALGGDDTGDDADDGETDVVLIDVPSVLGDDIQDAQATLLESNLVVSIEYQTNSEVPKDQVFGQNPPSGERVDPGSTVTVQVSAGTEKVVPNVIGEDVEAATAELQQQGYSVLQTPATSPLDPGTIIDQNPGAGVALAAGDEVEIIVSSGPEVVAVPDVEGLSVIAAVDLLRSEGFTVSPEQLEEPSEEIEEGKVVRTDPALNTLVPSGSQVSIVVSTGFPQVVVPQLDGLFADTAITTLRNLGLDPIPVFEPVPVGSPQVGRVIAQSPAAFEEVDQGSQITITIGEATAETTTTTTTTEAPTTTTTEGGGG